ncbi:MAG TPA: hypothetical protein PKC30_09190 [Saprospiraceae bacterium]|nr:hypothetical protein [Saprospiraceae bacterium]
MNMRLLIPMMSVLISLSVYGQHVDDKNKDRYDAQKIAYITSKLSLTADESKTFWPVYNKYQEKFDHLRKQKDEHLFRDDMTNEEAKAYLDHRARIDDEYIALRKKYYKELQSVVSVKKVAMLTVAEREFRNEMFSTVRKRLTTKEKERQREKRR